eukprot:3114490-Lingulodinium_polyedra.AAC.1
MAIVTPRSGVRFCDFCTSRCTEVQHAAYTIHHAACTMHGDRDTEANVAANAAPCMVHDAFRVRDFS